MPASPCGDSCLPVAGSKPTAGRFRQARRLIAAVSSLTAGAGLIVVLPLLPGGRRERMLRRWFRSLLAALDVRIQVDGGTRFADRGEAVLVISNHTSWIDVIALGAVQPLQLTAKSEVRDWMVIGPLATRAGTLYVDRERLRSLPDTIGALTQALRRGAAVGAFPEGTTWCGVAGGRFRPAVFQAAVDAGVAVRPVALSYRLAGRATTVASFVGDAPLWRSLVTVAGARDLVAHVQLLPVIESTTERARAAVPMWGRATGRRELAVAADRAVRDAMVPALPTTLPAGVAVSLGPSMPAGIAP